VKTEKRKAEHLRLQQDPPHGFSPRTTPSEKSSRRGEAKSQRPERPAAEDDSKKGKKPDTRTPKEKRPPMSTETDRASGEDEGPDGKEKREKKKSDSGEQAKKKSG